MYPTSPKNFKVIRQDLPYLPKIFQSNLSRCTLPPKKFKVICQDVPYPLKYRSNSSSSTTHKYQSNSSKGTLPPKKNSKSFIRMYPISQKNFKVICHKVPYTPKNVKVIRQDLPYLPKIFQSNLSR